MAQRDHGGRRRRQQLPGDFGETWVELMAAAGRVLHNRSSTLDLDKADVELTLQGEHWGTYSPTVKVQVKNCYRAPAVSQQRFVL